MSDLFHKDVPDAYIERVCEVMSVANWHTYQVLTKRHERMRDLLGGPLRGFAGLPHVWWGVSVENKKHGLPRVDALRAAPAAVRFLSVEPLLEALGPVDLTGIHWVIVGGESGHGARPFDPAWAIDLRDRCAAAGVKFFHKQNGSHLAGDKARNKKANGRLLDGRTYDEMPEITSVPVPPARDRRALAARLVPEAARAATRLPLTVAS